MTSPDGNDFEKAAKQAPTSIVGEFWAFLRQNKKWWLIPILMLLLVLGALIFVSGTALAPFIYNLF
jgi:hypothetical protein